MVCHHFMNCNTYSILIQQKQLFVIEKHTLLCKLNVIINYQIKLMLCAVVFKCFSTE